MQYKWHIFLANLDPVVGSEQGKTCSVLIISEEEINQILPIVNVLPITSRKPERKVYPSEVLYPLPDHGDLDMGAMILRERIVYPNEVLLPSGTGGLDKESIVLCHQIRTLDKRRLIKDMGRIEDIDLQEEIIEALCFQMGIWR